MGWGGGGAGRYYVSGYWSRIGYDITADDIGQRYCTCLPQQGDGRVVIRCRAEVRQGRQMSTHGRSRDIHAALSPERPWKMIMIHTARWSAYLHLLRHRLVAASAGGDRQDRSLHVTVSEISSGLFIASRFAVTHGHTLSSTIVAGLSENAGTFLETSSVIDRTRSNLGELRAFGLR